jgi:peptidoglycan hydrolase-like protein with peptidoglycan-binding domain
MKRKPDSDSASVGERGGKADAADARSRDGNDRVGNLHVAVGNQVVQRLAAGAGGQPATRVRSSESGGDTSDGDSPESDRFAGNDDLERVFRGDLILGDGASGTHVTVVQQALMDAGFDLPRYGADGVYGSETRRAVRAFQRDEGLSGKEVDGLVGPQTMGLLDQRFASHGPSHELATDSSRSLMEGTRSLSASDRTAVEAAITTEQRTPSGSLPTFNRTIPGASEPYEERIEERLNDVIDAQYRHLVDERPSRDSSNLLSGSTIDQVARTAKEVTDDVFGNYQTGPALTYGVNVFDAYKARDKRISASTSNADSAAEWRVQKILDGGPGIAQIDREHGAVQSRSTEQGLVDPVKERIVKNRRGELLEIHRNWPGYASGGDIYVQRYKASSDAENRDAMYSLFETFIHEYIHTLEHPDHETYREGLDEQEGGFVLREGMTDYLAKVVWDNLEFDRSLRKDIEGPFHEPMSHPIPTPGYYQEAENAEQMVGIVGARNAMAAYFLGKTDLIGEP